MLKSSSPLPEPLWQIKAKPEASRTEGLTRGPHYSMLAFDVWENTIHNEKSASIIVSANFPRQAGRARVFLEERQAV
ncbi:MAG: hypothetical protein V2B19_33280 [Pseudomonadota bacterium]